MANGILTGIIDKNGVAIATGHKVIMRFYTENENVVKGVAGAISVQLHRAACAQGGAGEEERMCEELKLNSERSYYNGY